MVRSGRSGSSWNELLGRPPQPWRARVKKPKTVIDAEAAASAKKAEFDAAKEAMNRLEKEWFQALEAVKAAQAEADAAQPQCRLVRVRWISGNEEDVGRVVIVRRTPSGMLVVRHVGEPDSNEQRFKWDGYAMKFRHADKNTYISDTRELRDVPSEYLPTCQAA